MCFQLILTKRNKHIVTVNKSRIAKFRSGIDIIQRHCVSFQDYRCDSSNFSLFRLNVHTKLFPLITHKSLTLKRQKLNCKNFQRESSIKHFGRLFRDCTVYLNRH